MDAPPEVPTTGLSHEELEAAWPALSAAERLEGLALLARPEAEDLFLGLSAPEQAELVLQMPAAERRSWIRLLPPDDAADLIQAAPGDRRDELLQPLDPATLREVTALLAYAEDAAGGLMNPRFARLRPDMRVDEAIRYLRRQAPERLGVFYYAYVLDPDQRLAGVASFRDLILALPERLVREIMTVDVVTVRADLDQEAVSRVFAANDFPVLPVVDAEGRMHGVVTADDIADVVEEEATEDIHKIGGSEALDAPYLRVGLGHMIRKRAGWLTVLFLSEMLTATAMGFFEHEIARAVVLALFIPLIISSGGNSGSQACTLVIRAMALGEVRLRDWWRVVRRECPTGLALGSILGGIGFLRIVLWPTRASTYGEHYVAVALTVALSLVGVVLWGSLCGSMLPFLLRRFRFDPASASAPFVATLVDVSGLVIYFTVASTVLRGTLL
jgi:magnesium transporter